MYKVRISVVVAVRNGAHVLQRCIDSFRDQTYPYKELIVVDGQSTDGTVEMLSHNDATIAWWISEADSGISEAWNKAVSHASGDWIIFLGADDYFWSPGALANMAPNLAQAVPALRIVYGEVAMVNDAGDVMERFGRPWPEMRSDFMAGKALNIHQATFHHRDLFEERGKFNESFRIAGDYELLLRELRDKNALFVPGIVAAMQHGGVSSNPVSKVKTIGEVIRAMKMSGQTPKTGLYLAWGRAAMHSLLYRFVGKRTSAIIADGYRALTGKGRMWS